MASLPPQSCCVEGVKHEGTPQGSVIDVDDIKAYATGDRTSRKAILLLTDVCGYEFVNTQLLADGFAGNGYFVLVPDLFGGDALQPGQSDKLPEWRPRHGIKETEPNVVKAGKWLHSELKPEFVGAVGYCFGAKYAIRGAGDTPVGIDAVAVAHPSFVSLWEVAAIKKPLLISAAEEDKIFTPQLRFETEDALQSSDATYFISLISGVSHGFAVRGDPSDPWQLIAKERAFADALWWFSLFDKKTS